jgi:hypothetical protein
LVFGDKAPETRERSIMITRIAASVLAALLSFAGHAVAAEPQNTGQQSAPFPDHTAIPEIIGTPIRESAQELRGPRVPMPVPAPALFDLPSAPSGAARLTE